MNGVIKKIFCPRIERADSVVVLTAWDEYYGINWQEVSIRMRKPSWGFDVRSIFHQEKVIDANLNFWRIGDGTITN